MILMKEFVPLTMVIMETKTYTNFPKKETSGQKQKK